MVPDVEAVMIGMLMRNMSVRQTECLGVLGGGESVTMTPA